MRSTNRLFMATILLTAAAAVSLAQDQSAAPAPQAPEPVVTPAAELAPVPSAEPVAPVVEPVPVAEPITLVPVVAPAAAIPPSPEKEVATTNKRVTRKAAPKPVQKPVVEPSESAKAPAAAAAVGATAVDMTEPPPPDLPAAAAIAAPLPPAAKAVTIETPGEEATPSKRLGLGSWILFGIGLAALAGIAAKFLRGRLRSPTSIVDFPSIAPELKPAPVPRS